MKYQRQKDTLRNTRIIFTLLISITLNACVDNPESPETEDQPVASEAVVVVNEGLWGQDNTSVSVYQRDTGTIQHNLFQTRNPGLRLGDTAASMRIVDNRGFIVMNGSNTIEIVDIPTFESMGRVLLPNNPSPRQIVVVNDSIAFVTALYTDMVLRVNIGNGVITDRIPVGPAPEGILAYGDNLFVTNSGLGDVRAAEEGAGTLSVINRFSLTETTRIPVLPNCTSIEPGADDLLYIGGSGFYATDTTSGIVRFDPVQLTPLDTLTIAQNPRNFVLASNMNGYVLTNNAVRKFNAQSANMESSEFIPLNKIDSDGYLYAVALDEVSEELFISNARNFTTNGEVVCFDFGGVEKYRFETQITPGSIVLY